MKNLFDVDLANQVKQRICQLQPKSERQWGQRSPADVLAHCALGLEMALGEIRPLPKWMGRLVGLVINPWSWEMMRSFAVTRLRWMSWS